MKVVTVVGARPQLVKASVFSRAVHDYNQQAIGEKVEEILVHSGQHYDQNMSDFFFQELNIPAPRYSLEVGSGSHAEMTAKILLKLEPLLIETNPDMVLVYGDTNTTLAAALAAVKLGIPVAHIEAGLRSFNMAMPEEINRIASDHFSTYLFCPTETAVNNLIKEGFSSTKEVLLENVGDIMYDAALFSQKHLKPSKQIEELIEHYQGRFYLLTLHRPVNVDDPEALTRILATLSAYSNEVPMVFPVHPRTKSKLDAKQLQGFHFLEPLAYGDMMALLAACSAVLTDSGGLQKEAYFFEKPCIVFREETEWVELVRHGCSELVGSDPDKIKTALSHLSSRKIDFSKKLYGDGKAGEKILKSLLRDKS